MPVIARAIKVVLLVSSVFALIVPSSLAQPAGTQVTGTVDSIDDGTLWLEDGTALPLAETVRVTQMRAATPADLTPGQLVAIAARQLADGTLDASLVFVFPPGGGPQTGQFPLGGFAFCAPGCQPGDLMTNATINFAEIRSTGEGEIEITYGDETAAVLVSQATRVEIQAVGSMDDVAPGAQVLGFINPQGVAATIWVYVE